MKLESLCVLKWYSATLGLSAGAVLYAYLGFGPVLPGILAFSIVSYYSLAAVRHFDEQDSPYQKLCEYIAAAGIIFFLPLIFMADFLVALVIFLGFAQLALNFQTHDYRRFYIGITVSFIGICVGAAESKSGFYLVFFLAYTISASLTIGYAYMAQRRDIQTRQWDWTSRARVCLLMIGLAAGIYLALPRLPAGGLFSQPGSDHFYRNRNWEAQAKQNDNLSARDRVDELRREQPDHRSSRARQGLVGDRDGDKSAGGAGDRQGDYHYRGFEKQFNINNPDEKGDRFSNRIVARMRADHPQYLRARIFDEFDGLHWRTSSDRIVKLTVGYTGVELVSPDHYISSQLQSYDIHIESNLGDYIAAAAVPVKLKYPATAIGVDLFGQLRSPGALKAGTAYAVTSQYNLQRGRLFAELDHQPLPSYTRLPEGMDPRIGELAGRITKGADSELDAAVALEQHLRTQYQYDLDSVFSSQNTTPLSEFLFERKTGHCEYFASALAVMLRTQNIPSRLVTGFSATNRNPLTGYFDIHALDGHAWVEAYVDNQGWVILEPTAYYDGPLPEEERLSAGQINNWVERQIRLQEALGGQRLTFSAIMNAAWQLLYLTVTAGLGYVKLFIMTSWHWMLIALILIVGPWIAWRRYKHLWQAYSLERRVKSYSARQPRKAVAFYLSAIEDYLNLAGFNAPPGYTIERYLQHIETIGGARSDLSLAAAFNRIYYNNEAGEQAVMHKYKLLFQSLSGTGFRNLQRIAAEQRRHDGHI